MPTYAPGQTRKRNVNDVLEFLGKDGDAKNILVRVDFNVPMDGDGKITDDSRIRGAIPTIKIILDSGNNAILMSHMGRPKKVQKGEDDGTQRAALSLKHVISTLKDLSGADVGFVDDCIGDKVKEAVAGLPKTGGSILVLENLRFRKVRSARYQTYLFLFCAFFVSKSQIAILGVSLGRRDKRGILCPRSRIDC